VTLEPGPQFRHGAPKVVVDGIYNLRSESGISYALDPKGGRFLMARPADSSATDAITGLRVVLNWFTELRAKVK
jgi:hypothetical protein